MKFEILGHFIEDIRNVRARDRIFSRLVRFENFSLGDLMKSQVIKKFSDAVYEIRIMDYRMLGTILADNKLHLVVGFFKDSQTTRKRHIKLAEDRIKKLLKTIN